MTNYINTIDKKGEVYEIYHTDNPLLKYLANRFLKRVEYLLNKIEAKKLNGIDIGSGEGNMLNILKSNGVIEDIIGIDLDEERISTAQKNYPDINFFVEDIYSLENYDKRFDYIIATEILEHLPKPELALNIFNDLVKSSGYLIISVPHEPYFQIGNLLRGKHWSNRGKTPAHLNFWSKKEFDKVLINNNIEIIKEFTISTFPWLLYLGRFNN